MRFKKQLKRKAGRKKFVIVGKDTGFIEFDECFLEDFGAFSKEKIFSGHFFDIYIKNRIEKRRKFVGRMPKK